MRVWMSWPAHLVRSDIKLLSWRAFRRNCPLHPMLLPFDVDISHKLAREGKNQL